MSMATHLPIGSVPIQVTILHHTIHSMTRGQAHLNIHMLQNVARINTTYTLATGRTLLVWDCKVAQATLPLFPALTIIHARTGAGIWTSARVVTRLPTAGTR